MASASPANPATAIEASAATSTALGVAAPVWVRRGGPTRSAVSTPFIPSNASFARLTPICSPAATSSAAPKRHHTTMPGRGRADQRPG